MSGAATGNGSVGRSQFPPWLAEAVGRVVLQASQCEDTLGELVVLHRGAPDQVDLDWWTSGQRLAEAVAVLNDPDAASMAEDYKALLNDRHRIVHGLWLGQAGTYTNVIRAKSTKADACAPGYEVAVASEEALQSIASAFRALEQRASDAVARYMRLA